MRRTLGFAAALLLLAGPAGAAGLTCALTYSCARDACTAGDITLIIEERDGQTGLVASDEFMAIEKRVDGATGWVTYITPVDNFDIYFMTVLPDGTALASGHSVYLSDAPPDLKIYAATGTCETVE
jgi:hypothetical protein